MSKVTAGKELDCDVLSGRWNMSAEVNESVSSAARHPPLPAKPLIASAVSFVPWC